MCSKTEFLIEFLLFFFQEINRLRQAILVEEQHLRAVSSPSYMAKNRDKALTEQSVRQVHHYKRV